MKRMSHIISFVEQPSLQKYNRKKNPLLSWNTRPSSPMLCFMCWKKMSTVYTVQYQYNINNKRYITLHKQLVKEAPCCTNGRQRMLWCHRPSEIINTSLPSVPVIFTTKIKISIRSHASFYINFVFFSSLLKLHDWWMLLYIFKKRKEKKKRKGKKKKKKENEKRLLFFSIKKI